MGGFCCCPCPDDLEEHAHASNPIYRQCIFLRYFFHQLLNGYNAAFQRLDGRAVASSAPAVSSLTSAVLGTNAADSSSLPGTHHLVPRPPPYDADPRYAREGLVSRREKYIGHVQEETQAHRRNGSSSGREHLGAVKKWASTESDEACKLLQSESSKNLSAKAYGTGFAIMTSEDEDVCPTCLEEYTPENPKIVAKCSHHFHLSCIYEWMERSDNCPICGKEMELCESP